MFSFHGSKSNTILRIFLTISAKFNIKKVYFLTETFEMMQQCMQTIQYLKPVIMYILSKLMNLLICILFIMNESWLDVTKNQRTL